MYMFQPEANWAEDQNKDVSSAKYNTLTIFHIYYVDAHTIKKMVNTSSMNLFNPKDPPVWKLIFDVFNFFQYASNKIFSHVCYDVS